MSSGLQHSGADLWRSAGGPGNPVGWEQPPGGRGKALDALCEMIKLLGDDRLQPGEILESAAALLPGAMRQPASAAAWIAYGADSRASPGFRPSPWRLDSSFATGDGSPGHVQVVYLDEVASADHGPFLAEEARLVEALGEMLRAHFERRISGEALRSSERRARSILESEPEGVALFSPEGQILDINPAGAGLFEVQGLADLAGTLVLDLVHPEDREVCAELHRRACGGEAGRVQFRARGRRGGDRWVEARAAPLRGANGANGATPGVVSVIRDITDEVGAQRHLADTLRFYQQLLELAPLAVITCRATGQIVTANSASARILGAPDLAAVLALDFRELAGWRDSGLLAAAAAALADGQPREMEARAPGLSGKESWLRCRLLPFAFAGERFLLGIFEGIGDRHEPDQPPPSLRLENIGALSGGVANDLHGMLAPVLSFLEQFKSRESDPGRLALLAQVDAGARQASDLASQWLSCARGAGGDPEAIDLRQLAASLEPVIRRSFPQNIDFRVEASPDLPAVPGDAALLRQALMNLCLNAREAMPEGGRLTLALDNVTVDEAYASAHPGCQAGPHVMILVEDTGSGIPRENQERIFDPFFTAKTPGDGVGLGLAATLDIVKRHGGFLHLDSSPGQGSRFRVYLPVAVPLPRGNGEVVLVVDGEESARLDARQALESHGYRVALASHGADAVALYAMHRDEIAVVLTAMAMPVMDGPATIRALRTINPEIKVIAASGPSPVEGAARLLPKPYTAEALVRAVAAALGREA